MHKVTGGIWTIASAGTVIPGSFSEGVLAALQRETLDQGSYYWPEDEVRPTSLRHHGEIKYSDEQEFWAWGTHSILDMDRIEAADEGEQDGAIRPLSPAEVLALFGSSRPLGT